MLYDVAGSTTVSLRYSTVLYSKNTGSTVSMPYGPDKFSLYLYEYSTVQFTPRLRSGRPQALKAAWGARLPDGGPPTQLSQAYFITYYSTVLYSYSYAHSVTRCSRAQPGAAVKYPLYSYGRTCSSGTVAAYYRYSIPTLEQTGLYPH